jgi:DNA-binding NarL/FixJ family response regulator
VLLISLLSEEIDADSICQGIRENEDLQITKIVAIANRLSDAESQAIIQKGFDGYLPLSAEPGEVVRRIEEVTAIIY